MVSFNFPTLYPPKGQVEAKQQFAIAKQINDVTLQLISEVLTKIQTRREYQRSYDLVQRAVLLDEALTAEEHISPTIYTLTNEVLVLMNKVANWIKFPIRNKHVFEEIRQELVYRLVRGGVLTIKCLQEEYVYDDQQQTMVSKFRGA